MKILLCLGLLFLIGCVGSPVHQTLRYSSVTNRVDANNARLLRLNTGLTKEEVLKVMGRPDRSEGYSWGQVFLYRTALTGSIYSVREDEFTPLVFDSKGVLQGWGRNFIEEATKKYDVTVH